MAGNHSATHASPATPSTQNGARHPPSAMSGGVISSPSSAPRCSPAAPPLLQVRCGCLRFMGFQYPNHAIAQMNHKLAHHAALSQHSIGIPLSSPLLKTFRTRVHTQNGDKGRQRARPLQFHLKPFNEERTTTPSIEDSAPAERGIVDARTGEDGGERAAFEVRWRPLRQHNSMHRRSSQPHLFRSLTLLRMNSNCIGTLLSHTRPKALWRNPTRRIEQYSVFETVFTQRLMNGVAFPTVPRDAHAFAMGFSISCACHPTLDCMWVADGTKPIFVKGRSSWLHMTPASFLCMAATLFLFCTPTHLRHDSGGARDAHAGCHAVQRAADRHRRQPARPRRRRQQHHGGGPAREAATRHPHTMPELCVANPMCNGLMWADQCIVTSHVSRA